MANSPDGRTATTPATVTNEDALAAYLERIQSVLCSFAMTERERLNAVAALAHRALLYHGGGYEDVARAARERAWKAVARG